MNGSTTGTTAEADIASPDTGGIRVRTRRRWLADTIELLSSMRFAISLLTLVAIASVIGTVLKQGEPMPNYVNQFGPFWFDVFAKLGLYTVYSAWWFLLIMGFLVLSTSLCIVRNTPKMLRDARSWRDNVREQSLRNFHHHAEWRGEAPAEESARSLVAKMVARGYRVKTVRKDGAILLAAKRGAATKWGYVFAHSAIVIICLGGMLDSDLPIRFQEWFHGKTPFSGDGLISAIGREHRLPVGNPTFRGNTFIPEGGVSGTAIIQRPGGVLVQDLPFTIELKKFTIDFYTTGMPKLFASDVVVRDRDTGKSFPATIKVNQPLVHDGVAIYQSSFDDGGSKLSLTAYPLTGADSHGFPIRGVVGQSTPLPVEGKTQSKSQDQRQDKAQDKSPAAPRYTIEWTGFRPFNVENMGSAGNARGSQGGTDARAVKPDRSFGQKVEDTLGKQLGSAAGNDRKNLRNVGPSVQYKLRDQTGQAREYNNYMQPIAIDGVRVFLTGMRDAPDEPFRYLRIPADDRDSVDEWMRLHAALQDPALRALAAQRYARRAIPPGRPEAAALEQRLEQSAQKGLDVFAGVGGQGGYVGVSTFLERLPAAEQEKAADIFMKILSGSLWDLLQIERGNAKLPPLPADEEHARFLQAASNALSDAFFYNAPVYLRLDDFTEIKASVLQVTRSPGKKVVYLGCLLLVLGVFSMLYIRERRLWVWLRPEADGGSHALMALSAQRRTLDVDKEFAALRDELPRRGPAER